MNRYSYKLPAGPWIHYFENFSLNTFIIIFAHSYLLIGIDDKIIYCTFCEFRKPTQSCRFLSSSIPKNFKFGGARARRTLVKVFMFKNCNTLTIITFFKFAKSFLLHQRTLAKKKIQNPIFNVFISPQSGKTLVLTFTVQRWNQFFSFFRFSLKKLKRHSCQ